MSAWAHVQRTGPEAALWLTVSAVWLGSSWALCAAMDAVQRWGRR